MLRAIRATSARSCTCMNATGSRAAFVVEQLNSLRRDSVLPITALCARSRSLMSKIIIAHLTSVDPVMGGVINACGEYGMTANLEGTPFLALARAIAHQQLNG